MFSLVNSNFALTLKSKIQQLRKDESGQDMIEYALVAALVALGSVTMLQGFAGLLGNAFNKLGNSLITNIP